MNSLRAAVWVAAAASTLVGPIAAASEPAGTITFDEPISWPIADGTDISAAGDFDRDGNVDIAVNNESRRISIVVGNAEQGFAVQRRVDAGPTVKQIAAGELDSDGDLDLVTISGRKKLAVLLGMRGTRFAAPMKYDLTASPLDLELADLDSDGDLDVAVAQWGGGGGVLLLENDGFGGLAVRATLPMRADDVAAGDFDANGYADLVLTTRYGVELLFHTGPWRYAEPEILDSGRSPAALLAVDQDDDGNLDLAVTEAYEDELSLHRGAGDGTFEPRDRYPLTTGETGEIAAADLDLDGRLDLVVSSNNTDIDVLRGRAGGQLSPAIPVPAGGWVSDVHLADVDGDGFADLLVPRYDDVLALLINTSGSG